METGTPTLIEGMSYRINSHSTSDDDSKYRRSESPEPGYEDERAYWEARSPIVRFGRCAVCRALVLPVVRFATQRSIFLKRLTYPVSQVGLSRPATVSDVLLLRRYLSDLGLWDAAHEEELRKASRARAIKALNDAEQVPNPHVKHLYTDVYDELPWMLAEQQSELKDHLQRYRAYYPEIPDQQIETL